MLDMIVVLGLWSLALVAVSALRGLAFSVLILFLRLVSAIVAGIWEALMFFLSIPGAMWRGGLRSRPIPRENTVIYGLYRMHRDRNANHAE